MQTSIDAISRMFASSKSKKVKKSVDTTDETLPKPVDIVVDTIIGFLEKSTAYMRTVGNQVFSLITDSVQESTVDLLSSVCSLSSWTALRLIAVLAT
jgi:DNA polymerase phi